MFAYGLPIPWLTLIYFELTHPNGEGWEVRNRWSDHQTVLSVRTKYREEDLV